MTQNNPSNMSSKGSEHSPVGENGQESTLTQNFEDVRILARGAGTTLVGRLLGRGIYAFIQIISARLLGPAAYGLYGIGWTILRLVSEISTLGLQHGIIRFGSEYWQKDDAKFKSTLVFSIMYSLLAGVAFGFGLFFTAPWIAERIFHKGDLTIVIKIMGIALPFMVALRVAASGTRISQDTRFSVLTEDIGRPAVNLALFILFFAAGWKLLGALWSIVLSATLAFFWAVCYLKRLFPFIFTGAIPKSDRGRRLILFSLPTALTGVFYYFGNQVDRFFVGIYMPSSTMGIYQSMAQVSILFAMILGAFNAIFAPMIADLYQQGRKDRLERMYRISTKWAFYLCIPIFLLILIQPAELMRLLFGEAFAGDTLPLIVLSCGQLFNVATGSVGFLLIMTGRQIHWLMLTVLMVLVSVALSIVLIPHLGLLGASLVATISIVCIFSAGLLVVYRSIGLWPYDRRIIKGLVAGVLSGVAGHLAASIEVPSEILKLFAVALTVGAIFFAALFLLGLDEEDQELIGVVAGKLFAPRV